MCSQKSPYSDERSFADALLAEMLTPEPARVDPAELEIPDVCDWMEEYFFIPETKRPIVLEPHQKTILRMFFERRPDGRFKWTTGCYFTIKKSGKTAVAGGVQKWSTVTWGDFGEIYHMGNKLEQAQERGFKATKYSIQLSPPSVRNKWDLAATKLFYKPGRSFIKALPVNAAGEAGANQRMTTWTELHGYRYEEDQRMWDEMQPPPTQPLTFRFAESYAGYEGESLVLEKLWFMALEEGERLHDELPIYGVPSTGLIAYIDTGLDARRMPWQTSEYYAKQEAMERPLNFIRIHLNKWVSSENAFIQEAIWDALKEPKSVSDKQPVVLGVDAAVSGDCTAVSVVWKDGQLVREAATYIFEPPDDGKIDYEETLTPILETLLERYNVRCVAYDEYQLHHLMTELAKEQKGIEFYAFPQGEERVKADSHLQSLITQGHLRHSGNDELKEHAKNANAKELKDGKAIRLVKKKSTKKIDGLIALSMAAWKMQDIKEPAGRAYRARTTGLYKRRV